MDPAEQLRYLILGGQREGARSLTELLRPAGVTAAQGEVLAVLRDAGRPLTVREIGERLVCEGGSPSRLVASLVDRELLRRANRAGDRRAVELSLTDEGATTAKQVRKAERALHAWIATTLDEHEIAVAIQALEKLVESRPAGDAIARRRT